MRECANGSASIFHRILLIISPANNAQSDHIYEVIESYNDFDDPRYNIEDS